MEETEKKVYKVERLPLQPTSYELWEQKYQLKDPLGNPVDITVDDTLKRTAFAIAAVESSDVEYWERTFLQVMQNGSTPAGRILANAGAEKYKPGTSLINCTVSRTVNDSIEGILDSVKEAGLTLSAGCGIGYEFSTLRPKGAYVDGAGATTSGPLSFMEIFDSMCFTIASAGGRRGAQMGTFAVWHPDVIAFINKKRENGKLRQFNLSLLIDDEFMEAVKNDTDYPLVFPVRYKEIEKGLAKENELYWKELFWEKDYCESMGYILKETKNGTLIGCKVYNTVKAVDLWNTIMKSTYDYAEPGFLLIDRINKYNPNTIFETIRATNPCGEQPLPPWAACLLGSPNLALYVIDPFTDNARFDWDKFKKDVRIFTRLLDNVVDINGLPLPEQQESIENTRRHGMGVMAVGSAISLLGMQYGDEASLEWYSNVMKILTMEGFKEGVSLAKEKGMAPILKQETNGVSNLIHWIDSPYMQRIWKESPELKQDALKYGCRFTHHTSIAPTGTLALTVNNNVSNGIEPTFTHKYTRNVVTSGKKSKKAVDVYSFEMLLYKHITGKDTVPEWFSTTDNVTVKQHVDMQAVAQYWVDSSISKTINVPTNIPFDEFKDVYVYAYDKGLKGCTTFRFNPEAFQGVLVKEDDLKGTEYIFITEDGNEHVTTGEQLIDYDGEEHTAANLFDAIKEGYYGNY